MIPFAKIAGGAPSSVGGLTDHLQNQTLTPPQEWMADYYNRGGAGHEEDRELNAVAKMVARGDVEFDQALDILDRSVSAAEQATRLAHIEAWADGTAAPDLDAIAAYVASPDAVYSPEDVEDRLVGDLDRAVDLAERRASGVPPLSPEARDLHGLSEPEPVPAYLQDLPLEDLHARSDAIMADWDTASAKADYEADVAATGADARRVGLADRLRVAVEHIEAGKPPPVQIGVLRQDMHPLVRRGLGLDDGQALNRDRINGMISGHRADGKPIEGKRYLAAYTRSNARTGEQQEINGLGSMDFCPSPHKSVSVAWAFAAPAEQAMVFNAHIEAAREAVAYIASEVGQMRLGAGGKDGRVQGHVGWIEFTHHTSRRTAAIVEDGAVRWEAKPKTPGDPELHTHFIMPATVWTEDGRVGALDTKALGGFIFEADGVYQALIAQKLRDSGFAVELDERTGAAKATIVPDDINALFSKRTNAGEALAKLKAEERGEDWDALSPERQTDLIKYATQDRNQKGRGDKDDVADVADWHRQAKTAGWEPPTSFLAPERAAAMDYEQRIRRAYEIALPHLDEKLQHQSVIKHWDMRVAALRGLVHTGYSDLDDVAAVTKLMREEGVTQYGERTAVVWGQEADKRYISITTALHESQEREFITLAKAAAADQSHALTPKAIDLAAKESGLDFSTPHGKTQLSAIHRLGEGGAFGVAIGTAGAGKSAMLKVLTAAWTQQGREVYGASLAWRQADDMVDGGIAPGNLKAFSVLLDGLHDGSIKLTHNTVVAVDELGLLGTRQGLELLRAREKHGGFSIVALGDDRQCASVEAGQIISLSRKALGAEAIPEILTTVRQQSDREREIVGLFREGQPKQALDMKRSDGTAEMVPGGYDKAVARVARLYVERLEATGQAPTISTPTNADAHRIGAAVRQERRKLGLIGRDIRTVKATDGERDYNLALACGDHVRLFRSTGVRLDNGRGGRIGRNGTVAEIVDIDDRGITLKSARTGVVGHAKWEDLSNKAGRVQLAYGSALTVHSSQGLTSQEHIFAMPAGSQAITGAVGYTASTRHRLRSYIVTSEAAERSAVRESRPINDTREIDADARWANVARNFIPSPVKDLAVNMSDRVQILRRGMVKGFQAAMQPAEQRRTRGQTASHAPEHALQKREGPSPALREMADLVRQIPQRAMEVVRQIQRHQERQRGFGMEL